MVKRINSQAGAAHGAIMTKNPNACVNCNRDLTMVNYEDKITITNYLDKAHNGVVIPYCLECFSKVAGKDFIRKFNQKI